MTDEELAEKAQAARSKIVSLRVGHGNAMWDVVFDAEALLKGEPAVCDRSTIERYLEEFLS